MYIRLVTVQVQLGKVDEAIALYSSLESEWKQHKGFLGAHLGINRSTDEGFSATIWESLEELQQTEASGWYQDVLPRFGSMLTAPPEMDIYEGAVNIENV